MVIQGCGMSCADYMEAVESPSDCKQDDMKCLCGDAQDGIDACKDSDDAAEKAWATNQQKALDIMPCT